MERSRQCWSGLLPPVGRHRRCHRHVAARSGTPAWRARCKNILCLAGGKSFGCSPTPGSRCCGSMKRRGLHRRRFHLETPLGFVSNQPTTEPCTGTFDCRTWPIEGSHPVASSSSGHRTASRVGTSTISAAVRSGSPAVAQGWSTATCADEAWLQIGRLRLTPHILDGDAEH
jgi:hypothetical protein